MIPVHTTSPTKQLIGDESGVPEPAPTVRAFGEGAVSGALVMVTGKLANFAAAFVAIAIIARLLTPADYGLVAMVTSATAFFTIFGDFGLSLVTIQRPTLSPEQSSTLFWINVGFGFILAMFAVALAPALVWFYGDARLLVITFALAAVFPLASCGTQHEALLKRNMKFRRVATVRLLSTLFSAAVGIAAALLGWGYWALVVQPIALSGSATILFWMTHRWIPGRPTRCDGLKNMLGFGGALTAHGMIGYFANNLDNILIGRRWGDAALGLYATSYSLMMRPISLAGYGVGEAAIPVLSRAATDHRALLSAFRKMFAVSCVLGLPVFVIGILWPADFVLTLLGSQWTAAVAIVPWLFLAGMMRMLMVPTGWVYVASGRPKRMLYWQLAWTPLVAAAFLVGLPFGAWGVAVAYAVANCLGFIPAYSFCLRGTELRLNDVMATLLAPACCAFLGGAAAVGLQTLIAPDLPAGPWRLALRLGIAAVCYVPLTLRYVPIAAAGLSMIRKKTDRGQD